MGWSNRPALRAHINDFSSNETAMTIKVRVRDSWNVFLLNQYYARCCDKIAYHCMHIYIYVYIYVYIHMYHRPLNIKICLTSKIYEISWTSLSFLRRDFSLESVLGPSWTWRLLNRRSLWPLRRSPRDLPPQRNQRIPHQVPKTHTTWPWTSIFWNSGSQLPLKKPNQKEALQTKKVSKSANQLPKYAAQP